MTKCFACDKKLGAAPQLVGCKDDQTVHVGNDCYRKIKATGKDGYQPSKGGPRLYLLQFTAKFEYDQNKMFPFVKNHRTMTD